MKTGNLTTLSAQYLVDCDFYDDGCDGGSSDGALEYIEKNGIEIEHDYPYHGIERKCARNITKAYIKISSRMYVKERDEIALKEAVANIGPIAVSIEATDNFQNYASGKSFYLKFKNRKL